MAPPGSRHTAVGQPPPTPLWKPPVCADPGLGAEDRPEAEREIPALSGLGSEGLHRCLAQSCALRSVRCVHLGKPQQSIGQLHGSRVSCQCILPADTLRRGQWSGWGPPWRSEGSECPTMVGTGALKDGGEVVGMGDFLGARDCERSLKSCSGGAETLAWGLHHMCYVVPSQLLECG